MHDFKRKTKYTKGNTYGNMNKHKTLPRYKSLRTHTKTHTYPKHTYRQTIRKYTHIHVHTNSEIMIDRQRRICTSWKTTNLMHYCIFTKRNNQINTYCKSSMHHLTLDQSTRKMRPPQHKASGNQKWWINILKDTIQGFPYVIPYME